MAKAEAEAPVESKETVSESSETETKETEVKQETKSFDPNSITPEIKDHFSKQYDGYDRYKAMSNEYEQLLRSPEFLEWYQGLGKPKAQQSKGFEITDDQYVQALSSKDQFINLVSKLAEHIAETKFGPELKQTKMQVDLTAKTNELDRAIGRYPDFMDLDKRGLIEPILKKYPGISFEDAYWLAKRHTLNEEIDKRARGLVAAKKSASVEKPGTPPGARTHKVKAKTRLEAMEIAAEAYRSGREVPDIEFE